MSELDITQRTLIKRSGLSKAVVREIQHHVAERRRSPRTLEALSVALEWPPGHLLALSRGEVPSENVVVRELAAESFSTRLAGIERSLDELHRKLDDLARSQRPGQNE